MNEKEHIDKLFKERVEKISPSYSGRYWKDMKGRLKQAGLVSVKKWSSLFSIIAVIGILIVGISKFLGTIEDPKAVRAAGNPVYKESNNSFYNTSEVPARKEKVTATMDQEISENPETVKDETILLAQTNKTIRHKTHLNKLAKENTPENNKTAKETQETNISMEASRSDNDSEINYNQIETENISDTNEENTSLNEESDENNSTTKPNHENNLELPVKKEKKVKRRPFNGKWTAGVYVLKQTYELESSTSNEGFTFKDMNSSFISKGLMIFYKTGRETQIQGGLFYTRKEFEILYNDFNTPVFPLKPESSKYTFQYLTIPIQYSYVFPIADNIVGSINGGVNTNILINSASTTQYSDHQSNDAPFETYRNIFISPMASLSVNCVLSKHLSLDIVPLAARYTNRGLIGNIEEQEDLLKLRKFLPEVYLGLKYKF